MHLCRAFYSFQMVPSTLGTGATIVVLSLLCVRQPFTRLGGQTLRYRSHKHLREVSRRTKIASFNQHLPLCMSSHSFSKKS